LQNKLESIINNPEKEIASEIQNFENFYDKILNVENEQENDKESRKKGIKAKYRSQKDKVKHIKLRVIDRVG